MTTTFFWVVLALLLVVAWIRIRHRLESHGPGRGPEVDDGTIRRILEEGCLESDEDEPLDMDEIEEEERRFWEESWDEPDAW